LIDVTTDYTDGTDFEEISAYGETFAALGPAHLIENPAILIESNKESEK